MLRLVKRAERLPARAPRMRDEYLEVVAHVGKHSGILLDVGAAYNRDYFSRCAVLRHRGLLAIKKVSDRHVALSLTDEGEEVATRF